MVDDPLLDHQSQIPQNIPDCGGERRKMEGEKGMKRLDMEAIRKKKKEMMTRRKKWKEDNDKEILIVKVDRGGVGGGSTVGSQRPILAQHYQ